MARTPSERTRRGRDDGGGARGRTAKPTAAQLKYLERGISEPGGKLPLFDDEGRQIKRQTIEVCIEKGWAEPWFSNPLKPDWLVCRLTEEGRRAIDGSAAC